MRLILMEQVTYVNYFSILNGVKIEMTTSIEPVNLHQSISIIWTLWRVRMFVW